MESDPFTPYFDIYSRKNLGHQLYDQLARGSERHAKRDIRAALQYAGMSRQFASMSVRHVLAHFREKR